MYKKERIKLNVYIHLLKSEHMLEAHGDSFYMLIDFSSEVVCFLYNSRFDKMWKWLKLYHVMWWSIINIYYELQKK